MNELYVGSMHCYLKTNATTRGEAEREFEKACEKAGIEIGAYADTELRDEEGREIEDKYGYIDQVIINLSCERYIPLKKKMELKTAMINILEG